MSKETSEWLNNNVLIGFTDKRGQAWHYRASAQGSEPNHYPGAIPVDDVQRRLFHWTAEPESVLVAGKFGLRRVPNKQAIAASDTGDVLGIFADGYTVHQYQEWLLDKVGTILDDGLSIGSAGLLRDRRQAWVSVEVPENITTPEGVEFRPNLVACTSHDGSLATTYKRTVTNVVCDNTMSAGLREYGQQFKVKHSKNGKFRIVEARDALAMVHTVAEEFAAEVKALCETTVTDQAWHAFLDAHTPMPEEKGRARTTATNERAALNRLWNTDNRVGQSGGAGSGGVGRSGGSGRGAVGQPSGAGSGTVGQPGRSDRGAVGRPDRSDMGTVDGSDRSVSAPGTADWPGLSEDEARTALARRWLYAFGPAPVADLRWWSGWTAGQTKKALTALAPAEVDLDGEPAIALPDDLTPVAAPDPWIALLPALDPTAMGWQSRDWYVGPHRAALFDRSGNIGPTIWSDGRIVGAWCHRPTGEVAVRLLEDIGAEKTAAVDAEAARLSEWLGEARVVPKFRTPAEKELSG